MNILKSLSAEKLPLVLQVLFHSKSHLNTSIRKCRIRTLPKIHTYVACNRNKYVRKMSNGTPWMIFAFCYTLMATFTGLNKTGTSQVGAISKAQKYSRNNYWKHLEIFFSKKVFFKKSHNAKKLKKRPFRLIKRFYKPKTSKKMQGGPLIEFENLRKSHIVPKKPKGGPSFSPLEA